MDYIIDPYVDYFLDSLLNHLVYKMSESEVVKLQDSRAFSLSYFHILFCSIDSQKPRIFTLLW